MVAGPQPQSRTTMSGPKVPKKKAGVDLGAARPDLRLNPASLLRVSHGDQLPKAERHYARAVVSSLRHDARMHSPS
jgi:hypothetical protein